MPHWFRHPLRGLALTRRLKRFPTNVAPRARWMPEPVRHDGGVWGEARRAPTPRPRTPKRHAGSRLGSSFGPARFRHLNDAGRRAVAWIIQDPWTPPARLPLRGARLDGCGIGPGGIGCPQGSCLPKRRPHSPSTRRRPERRICRGLPLNVARPSPSARRRHISRSRSPSRRFGNGCEAS